MWLIVINLILKCNRHKTAWEMEWIKAINKIQIRNYYKIMCIPYFFWFRLNWFGNIFLAILTVMLSNYKENYFCKEITFAFESGNMFTYKILSLYFLFFKPSEDVERNIVWGKTKLSHGAKKVIITIFFDFHFLISSTFSFLLLLSLHHFPLFIFPDLLNIPVGDLMEMCSVHVDCLSVVVTVCVIPFSFCPLVNIPKRSLILLWSRSITFQYVLYHILLFSTICLDTSLYLSLIISVS